MSDFTIFIVYCASMYLVIFLIVKVDMSNKDTKKDIWDYLTLYFAPISVPVITLGCLFKVMVD